MERLTLGGIRNRLQPLLLRLLLVAWDRRSLSTAPRGRAKLMLKLGGRRIIAIVERTPNRTGRVGSHVHGSSGLALSVALARWGWRRTIHAGEVAGGLLVGPNEGNETQEGPLTNPEGSISSVVGGGGRQLGCPAKLFQNGKRSDFVLG